MDYAPLILEHYRSRRQEAEAVVRNGDTEIEYPTEYQDLLLDFIQARPNFDQAEYGADNDDKLKAYAVLILVDDDRADEANAWFLGLSYSTRKYLLQHFSTECLRLYSYVDVWLTWCTCPRGQRICACRYCD